MILSAQTIRKLCKGENGYLLQPFSERTRHEGVTFGLSAAGYDVRIEFDAGGTEVERTLQPGEFLLASTIERFDVPNFVVGIVHDKSTWARRGIAVQNTVIEPGWAGFLTLELTNHSSQPVTIPRGVGIAQVVFHTMDEPSEQPYEGKYQDQARGPVQPISETTGLSSDPAEGKV